MSPNYLFTYGWLKRQYHKQLPFQMPKEFVGEAYTYGSLYKVADYPGVKLQGNNKVFGEIFSIDKGFDWSKMDEFELASPTIKIGPEYNRVQVKCFLEYEEYNCWMYEYLGAVTAQNLILAGKF